MPTTDRPTTPPSAAHGDAPDATRPATPTSPPPALSGPEMVEACRAHTLYTWSANAHVSPLPVVGAQGCYVHLADGRRLLDWNAGAMSVHVGYGDPRVRDAMKRQLDELPFAVAASATRVRARLGRLLADTLPGDIDKFLFCNSGAEANENALRMARAVTGRPKVLARYRSYHGSTAGAIQLTGDPRRWPNEPGVPGVIHVLDPQPYTYSFGTSDEERGRHNLAYLREVIEAEGPHTIAALFIEPVTGTNGVLPPPPGYLAGLRALCDDYGMLLVADEVMTGFGRTGKMFAFEHGAILPDIVTMAKGVTSSYAPLGVVGMRPHVAAFFDEHVYWGGHTYNAHPLALAAAEAVVGIIRDDGLAQRSARLGATLRAGLEHLQATHPSVGAVRSLGLFGMIDLQRDTHGTPMSPLNQTSAPVVAFKQRLLAEGLLAHTRWANVMCAPPLTITEAELDQGLAMLDRALTELDPHVV